MKIKNITHIAIFASILCIVCPVTINVFVIPFSFSTFIIYIISSLTKPLNTFLVILIYIILGLIGLPVFSSFTAGFGVLMGPTGGFIIGYLILGFINSVIVNINNKKLYLYYIGMFVGSVCCYIIGSMWYMVVTDVSFSNAILITVVPFIIFEIIKIIFAGVVSYILNNKFLKV